MRVIGLAGWSGAGKTTLLVRLIPELEARGLTVSTVKHAHHDFEIDVPGKDSRVHREAGASEVLVASSRRFALMHELRGAPEPTLADLLGRLSPVDLVIVEGFKRSGHPKIGVHRRETGRTMLAAIPNVVAIATNDPTFETGLPMLGLDDVAAIADAALRYAVPIADLKSDRASPAPRGDPSPTPA